MTPTRVQRKRSKGFRQPKNTKYVGRPTIYGNPFKVGYHGINNAMHLYRKHLERKIKDDPQFLEPLRQYKHISCFCNINEACHVDIIIEVLKRTEITEQEKNISAANLSYEMLHL